ncbi:MAG: amino acid permease [Bacteroidetes bacterium]|nr:amino acid permease [Bacteroidota bacterium]MBU1679578.1 amino acid permease [Bacteroidota bacterium]
MTNEKSTSVQGFGTAPVFFTAISTILGAILFLRFGYAVGTLGFLGVLFIIILGHLVTLPTAMAISEIATNHRVEGGGEYFIISRSFGLNIGATIGIALFLSQAISVAFYVIAFTEAFEPLFNWVKETYHFTLPRQVISVPTMLILAVIIIKKGATLGVKLLYFVVAILGLSLILFFLGSTSYGESNTQSFLSNSFRNSNNFFIVFAIVFPAFTGMTAGVGLSGDLKDPKKSIPLGTLAATLTGMIVYVFVIWKLAAYASPDNLINNQLAMSDIALFGPYIIPLGLAASTISSAIGSVLVAPRTLQALSGDESFPLKSINQFLAKGQGETNEPFNATIVACAIALVFVMLGDVNAVAEIISMFFMVTYGSICLISFLHHFGSDPSYRPTFKSKWFFSLTGFVLCVWLMFQMSPSYTFLSVILMSLIYLGLSKYHSDRGGLEAIFQGAIFQFTRRIQVFMQKTKKSKSVDHWRPSAVCVSEESFERDKVFHLLNWISYKFGFGTYIHLMKGYYSKSTIKEAKDTNERLLGRSMSSKGNVYIDTIISPSYTSAIAQILQLPSPSGMDNNMIIFEYDKHNPENLNQIIENIPLIQAGEFDVCILGSSSRTVKFDAGIHVWIRNLDKENTNLMIMLSYIILGHPDWSKSFIKILHVCQENEIEDARNKLDELVLSGRLPITHKNIEVITSEEKSFKSLVGEYSREAGLTILGFKEEHIRHEGTQFFEGYEEVGDILFVDAHEEIEIK